MGITLAEPVMEHAPQTTEYVNGHCVDNATILKIMRRRLDELLILLSGKVKGA